MGISGTTSLIASLTSSIHSIPAFPFPLASLNAFQNSLASSISSKFLLSSYCPCNSVQSYQYDHINYYHYHRNCYYYYYYYYYYHYQYYYYYYYYYCNPSICIASHTSSKPLKSRVYQRLLYLLTNQRAYQAKTITGL